MCEAPHFYARTDSFHRRKPEKTTQCQREEANEESPYVIAIVKRAAGCTENHSNWPQADPQQVVYFSTK